MPYELNDKIKSIDPYEPEPGSYRVRLDANESFLPPSDKVREAIRTAVDTIHFKRYPDPLAAELCAAAAAYYGVNAANVTAGNGSDELISVIFNAFVQKGDKIVTFAPDFSMYPFYGRLAECPVLTLPKRQDFNIDLAAAADTVNSENAGLVIFSNPCNPTSVGIPSGEIVRLIQSVRALVVLDEAYMDFYGDSLTARVEEFDNLIVLRTVSKAMGMAGIRLGFAVANPALTAAIRAAKSPYNVNAVTQAIGRAVFSDTDGIRHAVTLIKASSDMLLGELNRISKEIPGSLKPVAADANFVYTQAEEAECLFEALKKSGIIVRRFGNCLRITAGRNLENVELINAVERFYTSNR